MTADPAATADRVLDFLSTAGQAEYHGERVSQVEHALQAAYNARQDGGSDQEIIAALLHDLGHIWPVEGRQMTSVGVVAHDRIGAQALRELGFSDDVADIVSGHVAAKRYLVATDKDYAARLSDVSVESLRRQGGPMSAEEVEDFTSSPNWRSQVRVRTWDDRAKTPGAEVPGLETYREMLTAHLSLQQEGNG
jgi:predicted HD phosphohydrolase